MQREAADSAQFLASGQLQYGTDSFGYSLRRTERPPVAINGFDVVVLHDQQKWQLGRDALAAQFDGHAYLFSNVRHRAIFLAAPLNYVPALGGDCVVTFVASGERIAGKMEYGLLYQDRLFFVADAPQYRLFQREPERYTSADLAMDGICPVTVHQQQLKVPGIPATAAIYRGFRYLFAGAEQRAKFLSNPGRYTNAKSKPQPAAQQAATDDSSPRSSRSPTATKLELGAATVGRSPRDPQLKRRIARRGDLASARKLPKTSNHAGGQTMPFTLPHGEPIALGGYCPVSIREQGIWVLGNNNFQAVYDGQPYLFAGQKQRELFMKTPEQYIPALGGRCVVSQQDLRKSVPGSIDHAAIYANRLFLFAGAAQKMTFKAQPEEYADVDLAFNGRSVVAHREKGQLIDGKIGIRTWYGGIRYLFSNEEEKQQFLDKPEQYAIP